MIIVFIYQLYCFLLYISAIMSGKAWYYTGKFLHDHITSTINSSSGRQKEFFSGSVLSLDKLFHTDHDVYSQICVDNNLEPSLPWNSLDYYVFSGQLALKFRSQNCTASQSEVNYIHRLLHIDTNEKVLSFQIHNIMNYDLAISIDYGKNVESDDGTIFRTDYDMIYPLMPEIGLYNRETDSFERTEAINNTIGYIMAYHVMYQSIKHFIVVTTDPRKQMFALMRHTWNDSSNDNLENKYGNDVKLKVNIMTYNLWHNNPPQWVFHDPYERWKKYSERLQHWANVVTRKDPDIIILQEVRIDSLFTRKFSSRDSQHIHEDYGGQLDHILAFLQNARKAMNFSRESWSQPYYQSVYHPGMLQFDIKQPKLNSRVEEGLAILSKFPLSEVEVLLLARDFTNKEDDHQRIVLKATMQHPLYSSNVDVFSTHWRFVPFSTLLNIIDIMLYMDSLAESSRVIAAKQVTKFIQDFSKIDNMQILGGDFNAEISEFSLQTLIRNKDTCIDTEFHSSKPNETFPVIESKGSLIDLWCASNQQDSLAKGFTFPTNHPKKRIDFLLAFHPNNFQLQVLDIRLIGKYPSKHSIVQLLHLHDEFQIDSNGDVNESMTNEDIQQRSLNTHNKKLSYDDIKKNGMLNVKSATWASDHVGLYAIVQLNN